MNYYVMAFKKFATFDGRSSRSEYWYFALFNFLISIALSIVTIFLGNLGTAVSAVYSLAVIIPAIAVSVRRLHDTNRSGWWFLINFIPFIGFIIFIIFAVQGSDPGENPYGKNPFESMNATEQVVTPPTPSQPEAQAPVAQ